MLTWGIILCPLVLKPQVKSGGVSILMLASEESLTIGSYSMLNHHHDHQV